MLPSPAAAAVWRFRDPVPYGDAELLQEALVARAAAGTMGPLMLVLEHPLVVTLGRGADAAAATGGPVPALRTARGGSVTVHGPGQIVAYPILDLRATGRTVHGFVRELEGWMLAAAGAAGVEAERREGLTGIWTIRGKLGSIGIAVRRGITWHGLALYVSDQRANFGALNPCALPGVAADALSAAVPEVDRGRVEEALIAAFAAALAPRSCDIWQTDLTAARQAAGMGAAA